MLQLAAVYISSLKEEQRRALQGYLPTPDEFWQRVWSNTAAHCGSWRWYVSSSALRTSRASYFQNVLYGLFPTRTCKFIQTNLGNIPSGTSGYSVFGTQLISALPFYRTNYCCFSLQGQTWQTSPLANILTSDKCLLRAPLLNCQTIPLSWRWPRFYWTLHSSHYWQKSFRRNSDNHHC